MEGHDIVQPRLEAQQILEAEIRQNLWRQDTTPIYRLVPMGFKASTQVLAGVNNGMEHHMGRTLSSTRDALVAGSEQSHRTLQ